MLEGLDDELQRALAVVPSADFARARALAYRTRAGEFLLGRCGGARARVAAAILLAIGMNVLRSADGVRPRPSDAGRQPPATAAAKCAEPFPSIRL